MSSHEAGRRTRHLGGPLGGALTSVVGGLVGYLVIATTDLANAWVWWALLGASLTAAGIVLELRSGERSSLFGLGLAVGALACFGAFFLIMTTLELEIGL